MSGVSRTGMHEGVEGLRNEPPARAQPLRLGWFRPGGDRLSAAPTMCPKGAPVSIISALRERDTLLSVGEVDSDAGYPQALAAMDALWASDLDLNYVIVGGRGSAEAGFLEHLDVHPELGRRLFWLCEASDGTLTALYRAATALLAVSEADASGLRLIEAARFGLPIIARDVPVFREIAAGQASFFDASSGTELAAYLEAWLARCAAYEVPGSTVPTPPGWRDSARSLADIVVGQVWSMTWQPNGKDFDHTGA